MNKIIMLKAENDSYPNNGRKETETRIDAVIVKIVAKATITPRIQSRYSAIANTDETTDK